jgi:Terminase large subunit, T4likevirus-type, N-terminal
VATTTATRAAIRELLRTVERLEAERRENPLLIRLRAEPARIFRAAKMTPDSWQERLLRSPSSRLLLLCSRQSGKSLTAAALALREALLRPPALVLLLSPTQRQSGELFKDKVRRLYNAIGRPVACVQETQLTMELANGSRIIALPGEEETIRCYSGVRLLVIDEAARVPDALYYSVRPMLAVSRGLLVALSTPFGRRGWFYEEWRGSSAWDRVQVTATECPRISPEFLAEERAALGDHWYSQEYELVFRDVIDSLFRQEDIDSALACDVAPLDFGTRP